MRAPGSRPQRTDWGPPALVGHGAADCGPRVAVAGPQRSLSLSLDGRCRPIRPPADPHMADNRSQHGHPTLNASGWPPFSFNAPSRELRRSPRGPEQATPGQHLPTIGSAVARYGAQKLGAERIGCGSHREGTRRVAGSEADLLSRASFTSTPQSCPMGRKENRRAPLQRQQRDLPRRRSSPVTMR